MADLGQKLLDANDKHNALMTQLTKKFDRILRHQANTKQTRQDEIDEVTASLHRLLQADFEKNRKIKNQERLIRGLQSKLLKANNHNDALTKLLQQAHAKIDDLMVQMLALTDEVEVGKEDRRDVTAALRQQQAELRSQHRHQQLELKRQLAAFSEKKVKMAIKTARSKQLKAHKAALKKLRLPTVKADDCRHSYVHGDGHGHAGWKKTFAEILRTSLNTDEQYRAVICALHDDLELEDKEEAAREEGAASQSERNLSYRARKKLDELTEDADASRRLVSDYLESNLASVMDLLPRRHVEAIQKIGAEAIASSLAEHWTTDRCLYIKQTCRLSAARYNLLRNALTKTVDPATGDNVPLVINGTLIHPLASKYACSKRFKHICDEYGLQESEDGKTAWVNVRKRMVMDVREHIRMGHLKLCEDDSGNWVVLGKDDQPMILCFSFDAANFHKGMKQTSFGYKIANLMNCPLNSPHVFHEFALMEGKDNHEAISAHVGHIIDQVHKIILTGELTGFAHPRIGAAEVKIEFDPDHVVGCCDLVAGRSNFGQSGCNQKKPCFFCDCAKDGLCTKEGAPHVDEKFMKKTLKGVLKDKTGFDDKICGLINGYTSQFEARDIETCNLLAHVELGHCPACKLEIVDEVTKPEAQILRAQPGDKPPPVPAEYNPATWAELHDCQNYGEKVLFQIPVKQWSVCILHMNLRITGMLFERTVLRTLIKDPRSARKSDARTKSSCSRAQELYDLLLSLGIPCKLFSCPTNSVGKFYNSISKHSFAGNDSAKCLSAYESILKIAFPSSVWDTGHADFDAMSPDTARYNRAVAV